MFGGLAGGIRHVLFWEENDPFEKRLEKTAWKKGLRVAWLIVLS